MNLFEAEYKDSLLKHHKNIIPPNTLDPRVFYFPYEGGDPILLPEVKLQILNDIDAINSAENEYNKTRVSDYIMYGSILKAKSSDKCAINILVKINVTNLSDVLKERLLYNIKAINNRLAAGTTHPIVYVPTIRDFDLEKYEAAYHPYTDKWLKKPEHIKEAKTDIANLHRDPKKRKPKLSLKYGIRKLTTV
jgi:hypothetical protein